MRGYRMEAGVGWRVGGRSSGEKVMLSVGENNWKRRGGTADKKHNKTHRLFVRMPCRKLRQTLLVFAPCCISASGGELRQQTERVPLLLFCLQSKRTVPFVSLIQLCQGAEVCDKTTSFFSHKNWHHQYFVQWWAIGAS